MASDGTIPADADTDEALGFGHATATTRSGRVVSIRHLTLPDELLLAELLGSLGPQSRYLRFFTPRGIPDERLLSESHRMADIDARMHVALIVVTEEDGREWAVAEARLIRDDDEPSQAEVAILVRDDWQSEGIGTMLFDLLIQAGMVRGLLRVYAITLSENRGMRRLVQKLGLPYTSRSDGGEMIYWIALLSDQPMPGRVDKSGFPSG